MKKLIFGLLFMMIAAVGFSQANKDFPWPISIYSGTDSNYVINPTNNDTLKFYWSSVDGEYYVKSDSNYHILADSAYIDGALFVTGDVELTGDTLRYDGLQIIGLAPIFYSEPDHIDTTEKREFYTDNISSTLPVQWDSAFLYVGTAFDQTYLFITYGDTNYRLPVNNGVLTLDTLTVNGIASADNPYMYAGFNDSSETPAMTQNNWQQVTAASGIFIFDILDDITENAQDTFEINTAGKYELLGNLSFGGANNEVWEMRFAKTDPSTDVTTQVGYHSERYTGASDVGNASCNAAGTFSVGDKITFEIRNTTDDDDATFICGSVIMKYIKD